MAIPILSNTYVTWFLGCAGDGDGEEDDRQILFFLDLKNCFEIVERFLSGDFWGSTAYAFSGGPGMVYLSEERVAGIEEQHVARAIRLRVEVRVGVMVEMAVVLINWAQC